MIKQLISFKKTSDLVVHCIVIDLDYQKRPF